MSKWVRGYDGERHNLDLAAHLRTVPTKELTSDGSVAYTHDYAAVAIYYAGGVQLEAVLFIGEEQECDSYRRDLVGTRAWQSHPEGKCFADPRDQADYVEENDPITGTPYEAERHTAEEFARMQSEPERLDQFQQTANGEKLG